MQIHVVQRGETLGSISALYGVTVARILEVNRPPNPEQLVIGQALVIPADIIHIVRPGETLWVIANRYGTPIDRIVEVNKLTDPNRLIVGQRLIIPVSGKIHIVRRGETLWMIASRYGITVEAIIADNKITNPALVFPGQTLLIRRPVIEVNGYLTQMGENGRQIVRDVGRDLTFLSLFSYRIQADGSLTSLDDTAVLEVARTVHSAPLMVITNFSGRRFSSELAHTILSSPQLQDILFGNILNIMRTKHFYGLNIDFEYVFPGDRELYNEFIRSAVEHLHPEGYPVSTALAPKISADQPGLLYEAHDYPVHGRTVDFVILMTYEWGWAGGPPLAIAPINEVRRVLDYAVTAIPRNKILMGMPLYGRDWRLPYVPGQSIAATVSPQEAIRRAAKYKVDIQYNALYQSPFFRYVDEQGSAHEVWFEDARSAQAKYVTAREYRLRGVSYWELTSPFPQNWPVLEDNFQVRKLV